MEKKSKVFFIISLIVVGILSILIPLFIHIAFKAESPEGSFLIAEWGAGDMLSYCGSIIGSIIVVITVWYTLKTSNEETRKTIEASRKEFLVDKALSSFMEYADSVSYAVFDKVFSQVSETDTDYKFENKQDAIYSMKIKIDESKQKTFFYLTSKEVEQLEANTPNIEKIQKELDYIYEIVDKTLDLNIELKEKKISKEDHITQYNSLFEEYFDAVKIASKIIILAHEELLSSLKKIINNRLKETR